MPNSQTPNYGLSQWEKSDRIQMEDFNADNAKIDAALKAQAVAHAALAAKTGNCQIYVNSYVGDGTSGADYPKSFTFPKKPLLVFVISREGIPFTLMTPGQKHARPFGAQSLSSPATLTWSGNTLRWVGYMNEPHYSFNVENITYYVVALLAADQ